METCRMGPNLISGAHGPMVIVSPQDLGLFLPLPNGRTSWLKYTGVILTTYKSWDDPASTSQVLQVVTSSKEPFLIIFVTFSGLK